MFLKKTVKKGEHVFLVHGGTIIVLNRMVSYKEMLDSLLLFGGRCRSSNGQFLKDLSGIGIDNGDEEMLGKGQAKFCLADTRRTDDNE